MSPAIPGTVQVRTTLPRRPLPPNPSRAAIATARLTVRPFRPGDLAGYGLLRAQPEVMAFTAAGRVDRDAAETRSKLDLFLAPHDARTFNFAICLGDGDGELIGVGGVHSFGGGQGWPEVGYMLKREYWGRGYATEFLRGFVGAWWALEREEAVIHVDGESLAVADGSEKGVTGEEHEPRPAAECLTAVVEASNESSIRIMEKTGFRKFKTWAEPDSRAGMEGKDITLVGFLLERNCSR
ncbi:hypothetical protein KJ359_009208 [Pestalotiopsis sp. 9143b]|nr:hypothetical protein KJ359_009208 [Pestalotiopsis sp. 9143b]